VARIAGVDLPKNKKIKIALRYIFGIGPTTAMKILNTVGIDPELRVKDMTEEDASKIRQEIEKNYKVEGALRQEITENIKRLIAINCYRGIRHKRGLPVRGQRTHTNARTRKGPRPGIGRKRKG
jgi:small subunit ribosomal protein S13